MGALGLIIAPAFATQPFSRVLPMQEQSLSCFRAPWVRYWKQLSLQNKDKLEAMGLSYSKDNVSWHILPPSACSTWTLPRDCDIPWAEPGSAPSLAMGTLPGLCGNGIAPGCCYAECPPTPVCRSHLLCPHPPSSSINMALGWVYSSPSQGCMPVKRGGFCQLSLHILGTTRKYQHLGKIL